MKFCTMIALIAFLLPIQVAGSKSEPYQWKDDGYAAAPYDDERSAFPEPPERKHLPPSPHAPVVAEDDTDTHRSTEPSNVESMNQFSTIDPGAYFDRDAYLRDHVQGLVEDEQRFGSKSRLCMCCNVSWNMLAGLSTATSLVVSAIGATEYMDPRLANIITIVLGVVSAGCIWAGSQAKKASHEYHEKQTDIQKSLGVPKKWLDREVRIEIDQFTEHGGKPTEANAN